MLETENSVQPTLNEPRLPRPRGDTLTVDKMYCATCPLTVRAAILKVPGVTSVKVDFKTKTAVVTFDASKTTPEAVAAASTDVGYPAHLVKTGT